MSRLVNYGLGEICDRVSILALKILYGVEKDADVGHFVSERRALVPRLCTAIHNGGRWLEYYADLAAVNAALWECEDEIRMYKLGYDPARDDETVVMCAFRITELNDQRASLIRKINDLSGNHAPEKV